MKFFSSSLLLCILTFNTTAAQDSLKSKRLKPFLISSAVGYTGVMITLSEVWYDEHDKTSFHFFNDNAEWKQLDKAGHLWSAFHLSSATYEGLNWAGVDSKPSILWGSLAGLFMTIPVEWLDGYSQKYGASTGDLIANISGSTLFFAQQKLWGEIRITPKFSFHHTGYAELRPEVLGSNWTDRWLKDYNGQTYWLSFDLDKFFTSNSRILPYVNISLGYGAEDFIYARDNANLEAGFKPYRQYYLSLDFDPTAIKTNNKWIKRILFLINTIHIPSPALSYGNGKLNVHYFYF